VAPAASRALPGRLAMRRHMMACRAAKGVGMSPVIARHNRHQLGWIAGTVLLLAAGFWVAFQFVQPAPPHKIVVAAASKGSPYYRLAEQYRDFVARSGVTLEIRETSGSLENLRLLQDAGSGVSLGFLQGGITSAAEAPQLRSIGRILYEPLWVFYRGDAPIDRLSELAGKRVLVGPAGGGTNHLARKLLAANGVSDATATLIEMELPDYVEALESGKADAGLLVLAPDARTVGRLFDSPHVHLMSLALADAYSQRFPFLSRVELKQGVVDLARNIPLADTTMVATVAALVVRDDMTPALVNLMTQGLLAVHAKPVVGADGMAPVLSRAADFPIASDPEFPTASEAARVYKSGPPFLQRYMPFWLATLLDRMVVLLIPLIGLALPLMRFAPMLYTWRQRSRITQWYGELRKVEHTIQRGSRPEEFAAAFSEIDRIEAAVDQMSVPLGFSNQVYDLREHIAVVRSHLGAIQRAKGPGGSGG
jgi:TRAP-type uncharacterized transport system substrate-binding protein